jgi:hypothetical protein
MTAALYGEVVSAAPARYLQVVRTDTDSVVALPPRKTSASGKGVESRPFAMSDPLLDGAARLLSVPVRHVYAALWRAGVLDVRA